MIILEQTVWQNNQTGERVFVLGYGGGIFDFVHCLSLDDTFKEYHIETSEFIAEFEQIIGFGSILN